MWEAQHLSVYGPCPSPILALTSKPTSADREPGFTWLMKMPGFWTGPLEMLRDAERWVRLGPGALLTLNGQPGGQP